MRILILSNSDSGLYEFRKELIETICKTNSVLCCVPDSHNYVNRLKELGCDCLVTDFKRRSINPFGGVGMLISYLKIIKEFRPDVVLSYTIKPNVFGGIACRISKTPYIATITGLGTSIENAGILRKVSLMLYMVALKDARCVFFQNQNNRTFFINNGIRCAKTVLVPGSGVNTDAHCLEPYPEDGDRFEFLYVGRIMKDKGIEELLGAAEKLSNSNKQFCVHIVGAPDEDYSDHIIRLKERGIVRYYGERENIHDYYAMAHCVVLPSYHEGMSNVMLEAASTGRPVITTRVPGCIETFDEGVTGFGCDSKSTDSLADAMRKMMELTCEERREMGLAGRNKVIKEFDRSLVVSSYISELNMANIKKSPS